MEFGRNRRLTAGAALTLLVTAVACTDPVNPVEEAPARLRIVNALYRGSPASAAIPIALDVLVDSSDTAPGVAALEPNSVSSRATEPFYAALPAAVHSFVARVGGQSPPGLSLYTASTSLPYLPRLRLTTNTRYTLVVAGIVPPTGLVPPSTVPFAALVDDHFPPPSTSNGYLARFRVINAAPFAAASGNGATVNVFVTPGDEPAPTAPALAGLAALGSAAYRGSSVYMNVSPRSYWVTLAAGATVLHQSQVSFTAGAVRTLVLFSTGFAAAPGSANHRMQMIVDAQY